jgi:dTMP kinase
MILVTFEGIDGSGKSTQAQRLFNRLSKEGYPVEHFREPGGSVLPERIRSILLDPSLSIHALPELLLFCAARAQLVDDRIRPALAEGTIVVCDRFYDSTTAYQGAGRQVAELDWVRALNMRVTGGLEPDRTYLMALSPEEARRRTRTRSEADRMERSDHAFYRRVADAYERLAAEESDRIVRLDAARPMDDLAEEIWTDVRTVMDRSEGTARSG